MVRYHNSGTQKFDDTEHDSVKTEDATITDGALSSDASNPTTWSHRENSDAVSEISETGIVVTAGNSATPVITHANGGSVVVRGRRSDGNNIAFIDAVLVAPLDTTVLGSVTWGSAPARSYSEGSSELRVAIDGSSNDWDVSSTIQTGSQL